MLEKLFIQRKEIAINSIVMTTYTTTTITTKLMCSSRSNTAVVCNNLPLSSPEPICNQKYPSSPTSVSPKDLLDEFGGNRRRISESESDDSFIVFEEMSPCKSTPNRGAYNFRRRSPQVSECSSDDFIVFENGSKDTKFCYETTTDDDDEDETDSSDTEHCTVDDDKDQTDAAHLPDPKPSGCSKGKRVTFNLRPIVHEIRAWKFAYAQARKGHWHQIGWDRERFEMRINNLSQIVSPILIAEHRQKIYVERFHEKF